MRDRMQSGHSYLADDPVLAAERQAAMVLVEAFNSSATAHAVHRREILEELLGAFGEDSEIRPPLFCDYGCQLHVGARTFTNFGLVALDAARITIGDDVQIGPNVQLLTPTHPLKAEARRRKVGGR